MTQFQKPESTIESAPARRVTAMMTLLLVLLLWVFPVGCGKTESPLPPSGKEQPVMAAPAEPAAPAEVPGATGSKRLRTRSVPDPIEIQGEQAVPDPVEIQK
jgi:hypothetical protein